MIPIRSNVGRKMIKSARRASKLDTKLSKEIANGNLPDSLFSDDSLSHQLHNEETGLYVTYLGYIDNFIDTCNFLIANSKGVATGVSVKLNNYHNDLMNKRARVLTLMSNKKSIYYSIPGIRPILEKIPVSDYFDQLDEFENVGNKDLIETFKKCYLDGYNSKDIELEKVEKIFDKAVQISEKNRASNDLRISHAKFR